MKGTITAIAEHNVISRARVAPSADDAIKVCRQPFFRHRRPFPAHQKSLREFARMAVEDFQALQSRRNPVLHSHRDAVRGAVDAVRSRPAG